MSVGGKGGRVRARARARARGNGYEEGSERGRPKGESKGKVVKLSAICVPANEHNAQNGHTESALLFLFFLFKCIMPLSETVLILLNIGEFLFYDFNCTISFYSLFN
jgi:hypothetical protein